MEKLASTVFTGLHINGAHMLPSMDDSPLNETMSYTGQLNLKHYQKFICHCLFNIQLF